MLLPPKKHKVIDLLSLIEKAPLKPATTAILANEQASISKGALSYAPGRSLTASAIDRLIAPTRIKLTGEAKIHIKNRVVGSQAERLIIEVAPQSKASISWEGTGEGLLALHIEMDIGEGSEVSFEELQDMGAEATLYSCIEARLQKDARLSWALATLGARFQTCERIIRLQGAGSHAKVVEAFFGSAEQVLDQDVILSHEHPDTSANLLSKGILTGKAKNRFVGLIKIAEGAQRTNSFLAQHGMLLSPEAISDSTPSLEIAANDVKASHAASTGQIDEEQLFYLQARGISTEESKRLIVSGFLEPALAAMHSHDLTETLRERIAAKWAHS